MTLKQRIEEIERHKLRAQDFHEELVLQKHFNFLIKSLNIAVEALEKVRATSHSWVITERTGPIEKPIHDKYRSIAIDVLSKLK